MSRKIYSVFNWLLSSLIALLGFGACKTTKTAVKEPTQLDQQLSDSLRGPNSESGEVIKRRTPSDGDIRLLYGPPPSRKEMRVLYGPPPTTKNNETTK